MMKRIFVLEVFVVFLAIISSAYALPPAPSSGVTGTGTNHYWAYWTGTTILGAKSLTASKPVCTDSSGDPGVCAGTEGVWQVAGAYLTAVSALDASKLAAGSDAQDDVLVRGASAYGRLNITEQTLIGRITGGHVAALSTVTVKTLLGYPTTSTDGHVALFDGITGNLKDGGALATDNSNEGAMIKKVGGVFGDAVADTDYVSPTATRTANTIYAGPVSGEVAAPTFRALVAADMPTDLSTIAAGGAANCLWGEKSDSSGVECKSTIQLQIGDGAAQFIGSTAGHLGLFWIDLAGSTTDKTRTIVSSHTDDRSNTIPDAGGAFLLEGTATGGIIFGDAGPDAAGEIGYDGDLKYYNTGIRTVVNTDEAQTLTGPKTLVAPLSTLPRVDGSAAISPLSAAQVSGTVIRNTGQALTDVNHTLPQAAAGYNFIAFVGTTLAATNYWRFTADASPQDYMCLDGTCGKTYVSVDTPTMGDTLTCYTEQMSSTGLKNEADLAIGTSAATAVKNTAAIEFDIAGTGYSKAIAETAPGNDVIPQGKFGAVGFEIGVDGTIHAMEAADNATGYDTAALALAAAQAVALTDANHTRIGYVTASKSDGDFTFGTTELGAANTTVAYTDVAVYTPPFGWVCIIGKGTWITD